MSKTRIRFAPLALATALILAAAGPAPLQDSGGKPAQTPLLQAMEGIKTHMKGTAMALQGGARDEALKHIAEIQRLVLLAKLEAPANLTEVPEEKRAAHRTAFRKDIVVLLKEFADMEVDVLEGRFEEAFGRVIDPLYPYREASHDKYKKKE